MKAEQFYKRKREAKRDCQQSIDKEAICLVFAKNLLAPNITTNDVYYKRQMSTFFNIHVLSTSQCVFYGYPETVGKRAVIMYALYCTTFHIITST